MGFFSSIIPPLLKCGVVAIGAFFLTFFTTLPFAFAPFPKELLSIAKLLVLCCYALAIASLVFFRNSQAAKIPLKVGLLVSGGVSGIGLVCLIVLKATYQTPVLVASVLAAVITLLYTDTELFRTHDLKDRSQTAGFEITEIPRAYLKTSDQISPPAQSPHNHAEAFRSLLETAAFAGVPVGLRIMRVNGRIRIFFFSWADNPALLSRRLSVLRGSLSSCLPHFNVQPVNQLPNPPIPLNTYGIAHLFGEPDKDPEGAGVTALCEAILAAPPDLDIMYQVFATPVKPSRLDYWFTRRQHKSAAEKAGATLTEQQSRLISLSGQGQRSLPNTDLEAKIKAERLERELIRLQSRRALALRVTSLCWHNRSNLLGGRELEYTAQSYLNVLSGTIKPVERKYGFKVSRLFGFSNRPFVRLLRGNPTGNATLLLPEEAAPYFTLPRNDVGILISDRQPFSVASYHPPSTPLSRWEGSILEGIRIGTILDRKGQPTQQTLVIEEKECVYHFGVYGNPNSGKTNTAFLIVWQLWKKYKIPFLAIVPAKNEWRQLLNHFPGLRVFTAVDRRTAPFFFNFFNVPDGVPLLVHIGNIAKCFLAYWPCYGIMESHVQRIFWSVYERCGWNLETGESGRPILLQDLYIAMLEFAETLQYGSRMKQDFIGAYVSRVESLIKDPNLSAMFNVEKGLSIPELLSHPTVLELARLQDEEKALIASLIATCIAEYLEVRHANEAQTSKRLRHLMIFEEAHRILQQVVVGSIGEGNSAQQKAINTIVLLLREARAFGLGIFLIDQLPSSLAKLAVKLTGITIIHHLKDPDERRLVGKQANCTEENLRHIGIMRVGEAIIHVSFRGAPRCVQVDRFPSAPSSVVWTDALVAKHMQPFFEARPHLRTLPVPDTSQHQQITLVPPSTLNNANWEPDPAVLKLLLGHISRPRFREKYIPLLDKALKEGYLKPVAVFLLSIIRKYVSDPKQERSYCGLLLNQISLRVPHSRHIEISGDLLFTIHDLTSPLEGTHRAG